MPPQPAPEMPFLASLSSTPIDISQTLGSNLEVWPGDPPLERETVATVAEHGYRVTRVSLGTHLGTHIDAPSHVLESGADVATVPLNALVGMATVLRVPAGCPVDVAQLKGRQMHPRLLLAAARSELEVPGTGTRVAGLTEEAAAHLLAQGITLVGLEGASVDAPDSHPLPVHRLLLRSGVAILENLELANVQEGHYFLCCLPLKLEGTDGAPARAVLFR